MNIDVRTVRALLLGLQKGAETALANLNGVSDTDVVAVPVEPPALEAVAPVAETAPEAAVASEPEPTPEPEPEPVTTESAEDTKSAEDTESVEPAEEQDTPSNDEIDAMTRPQVIQHFEDFGIIKSAEFQRELGTLKRKQLPTLKKFLKAYHDGVESGPVSQQVPPSPEQTAVVSGVPADAPAPVTTPEVEETEGAEAEPWTLKTTVDWTTTEVPVIPTAAMHPDVQDDSELREQALEMMGFFAAQGNGPVAGKMAAYHRRWGCNGVCLLHDKNTIAGCVRRLTSAG